MTRQVIGWLDSETGGFAPHLQPLEVAVIMTDTDLNEIGRGTWLVGPVGSDDGFLVDEWSRNQHTQSGLLRECVINGRQCFDVDTDMKRFLSDFCSDEHKIVLAGASVHFDFKFFERWFPRAYAMFNHRLLDTSAWRVMQNLVFGKDANDGFIKSIDRRHRALDDIAETLVWARHKWQDLRRQQTLMALAAEDLDFLVPPDGEGKNSYIAEEIKKALEGMTGVDDQGRTWSCTGGVLSWRK